MLISGTCDLPTKALFLNMQQYNSKFGCQNCTIETQRIEQVQSYPITIANLLLRTTEETNMYAQQALTSEAPVYGIKGPSMLAY